LRIGPGNDHSIQDKKLQQEPQSHAASIKTTGVDASTGGCAAMIIVVELVVEITP